MKGSMRRFIVAEAQILEAPFSRQVSDNGLGISPSKRR